jgi:hypothetical protein
VPILWEVGMVHGHVPAVMQLMQKLSILITLESHYRIFPCIIIIIVGGGLNRHFGLEYSVSQQNHYHYNCGRTQVRAICAD